MVEWPRTSGNRIFANAVLGDGTMVAAEWTGETWQTLVSRLDRLPNGTMPTWVGIIAANRHGDVAVGTGEGVVAVRRKQRHLPLSLTAWRLVVNSVLVRDDGTLYLTAGTPSGELVVYKATPI